MSANSNQEGFTPSSEPQDNSKAQNKQNDQTPPSTPYDLWEQDSSDADHERMLHLESINHQEAQKLNPFENL
jgi:hypothetical protein